MEKSNNNANNGALIKSFILMAVVLGFIGGFALSLDLKNVFDKAVKKEYASESSDVYKASVKDNKTLGFDEKYVMSDEDYDYNIDFGTYAGSTDLYFSLEYGNNKKTIKVLRYNYDNEDVQEFSLEFLNNVVDIFEGQFENDSKYNTIFYLLDNGDVCYSLIEDMVEPNKYGTYVVLTDIRDAVKFYKGNACTEEGVCETTTFVQLKSGKILDLKKYVV